MGERLFCLGWIGTCRLLSDVLITERRLAIHCSEGRSMRSKGKEGGWK